MRVGNGWEKSKVMGDLRAASLELSELSLSKLACERFWRRRLSTYTGRDHEGPQMLPYLLPLPLARSNCNCNVIRISVWRTSVQQSLRAVPRCEVTDLAQAFRHSLITYLLSPPRFFTIASRDEPVSSPAPGSPPQSLLHSINLGGSKRSGMIRCRRVANSAFLSIFRPNCSLPVHHA